MHLDELVDVGVPNSASAALKRLGRSATKPHGHVEFDRDWRIFKEWRIWKGWPRLTRRGARATPVGEPLQERHDAQHGIALALLMGLLIAARMLPERRRLPVALAPFRGGPGRTDALAFR